MLSSTTYIKSLTYSLALLIGIAVPIMQAAQVDSQDYKIIEGYAKNRAIYEQKLVKSSKNNTPITIAVGITYNGNEIKDHKNEGMGIFVYQPIHQIVTAYKTSFDIQKDNLSRQELIQVLEKRLSIDKLRKHEHLTVSIKTIRVVNLSGPSSLDSVNVFHYDKDGKNQRKGKINYASTHNKPTTNDSLYVVMNIQSDPSKKKKNNDDPINKSPKTWKKVLKWFIIISIVIGSSGTVYLVVKKRLKRLKKPQ